MRTPIIVKRGSIELRTNRELHRDCEGGEDGERLGPCVYRYPGWFGRASVDAFEVSGGSIKVRDDKGQGERELHVWPAAEPNGEAPFVVRIANRGEKKGFTITTRWALEETTDPKGGRLYRYVYKVDEEKHPFSYVLHADGTTIESRNLDDAAFVLGLRHWFEVDLSEPLPRYLALGAAAGLLGALLARQLGSRRHRE
jgi:hypothetical protein